MNEQQPYTQSLETAPINPDRDFHRQTTGGGYEAGIAGSQGRSWTRDPYQSGGSFDNYARKRVQAADPFGLRNVGNINSRTLNRTNQPNQPTQYASMEISPPQEVLRAGGLYD